MDTNTAIATITALKATIDSNITGLQAQSDALGVALEQLQGTLKTESADIAEAVQAAQPMQAEPSMQVATLQS